MVNRSIASINAGANTSDFKITLLDGLHIMKTAWESVTESTISNCFRKAGFSLPLEPEVDEESLHGFGGRDSLSR